MVEAHHCIHEGDISALKTRMENIENQVQRMNSTIDGTNGSLGLRRRIDQCDAWIGHEEQRRENHEESLREARATRRWVIGFAVSNGIALAWLIIRSVS